MNLLEGDIPSQSVKLIRIKSKAGSTTKQISSRVGMIRDSMIKFLFFLSRELIVFSSLS